MATPVPMAPKWLTNWLRARNEPRSASVVMAPMMAFWPVMAIPRARLKPTTLAAMSQMAAGDWLRASRGANRIGVIST